MKPYAAILTLTLLLPIPAFAQQGAMAAEECSAGPAALPAELAGWSTKAPLVGAVDKAGLGKARLPIGSGIAATLTQTSKVSYVTRPEKPGGSVSFGGLFSFDVAQAGTYRVALGSGAWIDLLKGKVAIVSTAHGHGPACTSIRKMVDFPLKPGRYTLQIAGNGAADLPLMVARLP